MSIKSQEGHMRQLALLLTTDLGCIFDERESGPNGSKKAFLNVGKVFLRALAKDLGLHEVTVSANSGGIAVSGTCSLYGMWEDRGIAVWIEQRLCADGKVLCYAGYVNNIEKRIVPYFRRQRILLRELTALDVENFYSYCFNELHLKGTTVQRFHANIHKAMKYARKHDLIASNPMDNVERPKSQRYVGAFYSVSELETLFQAVKGDPCEFPVLMAAFYGLRRSEIMGLRWRAIDFENNLITIDHTVVQCMCDGTTITVEKDRTKNQSSCRSMPLVPQYRDLLLRMKVRQECCRKLCGNCYTESEYIFVNDMGVPYQPNYVTQHFKLVLRKNHLRSIRFHDLRHTCASLLLKNGVPMKDIQEWLGHSSYNTTANIYAHLDTSSKNTSASKMSNVVIIEPGISTSV